MAGPTYQDGYWYSADGLRLHYRDYPGDAARAPILCIPGLTRNARDFEGVAARLAGTRRVIAVDLRGRGESEYAADPLTYVPQVYLQDLLALIVEHDLPPLVAFGTSLGGLMTMLIALTDRAFLAGVLLNDIGPVLGAEGMARIRSYVGREQSFAGWDEAAQAIAAPHTATFPNYTAKDWRQWAYRVCRRDADGRIRFDYDMAIATPFKLPVPDPAFDLWPAFQSLHGLPTLLVRGEHSDVLEAETASEMAHRLPEMDFVTLPGIGHTPTLEEPEVAAAIDHLLEAVDQE
ncbi:alpha/beta fold hydrolase [Sphingomonas crusticola]|uniref:alpha/beta fold hydrolase n=1 Tax=Sphingomonas crusticola TaxID=1697973 RepID=UPI000E21FEFB|nr:alpha/beta hydrolase [Sphingomonas crusticola]